MAVRVFVVDDSQMARKQVAVPLCEAGYAVVEATDGVDALEKLAAHPDTRVIVCDLNMPRMDGLELLGHLKERFPLIPVLMLTTEGAPELMRRAKELGARVWLLKPVNPEYLLAAVRRLAPEVSG